jgi:flagellin
MALTVNTNVASINAQRNLQRSTLDLRRSLERLSSGLRINRAGDDAAGLAISENLRSQIRGMRQAVRNANDGLSLVGTAEGALGEATNILQRIRELAVQAANDTNSDSNRAALQNEISQLITELDRIGNTTQFNGRNLLDGTFTNVQLQVGPNRNQTISLSIDEVRASNLGSVAEAVGTAVGTGLVAGDLDDITVDGVAIDDPLAGDDTVSTVDNDLSAISLMAAINRATGQTDVIAEIQSANQAATGAVVTGVLATGDFVLNGVDITGTFVDSDTNGDLVDAVNAVSQQTGVTASITSGVLSLTAEDGRNIEVITTAAGEAVTSFNGAATTNVYKGSLVLRSSKAFTLGGTDIANAGFTAATSAVDATTAINRVDVSSAQGAQDTILTTDFALNQLNDVRAELGAITNRLESTIANLQTTAENLSASESRIRDADFALETASLTRSQILQQAGVSILAQANLVPQAALSLLQR